MNQKREGQVKREHDKTEQITGPLGSCPACKRGTGGAGATPGSDGQGPVDPPVDPMEAYLADLPEWARGPVMAYGRQALAGIVLFLLAVGIWTGFSHYMEGKETKAAYALGQALSAPDAKERMSLLKKVVSQYGSTDAGAQAQLVLSGEYLEQDEFDKARDGFVKARKGLKLALKDGATMGESYALEEKKEYKAALDGFSKAIEKKQGYEAVALLDKARISLKLGNSREAMEAYNQYLDIRPDSPLLDFIRFKLQKLASAGGAVSGGTPQEGKAGEKEAAGEKG